MRALGQAASDDVERDELVRLRASEALWEAAKKGLAGSGPFSPTESERSEHAYPTLIGSDVA